MRGWTETSVTNKRGNSAFDNSDGGGTMPLNRFPMKTQMLTIRSRFRCFSQTPVDSVRGTTPEETALKIFGVRCAGISDFEWAQKMQLNQR
jgi:hypothetical protein